MVKFQDLIDKKDSPDLNAPAEYKKISSDEKLTKDEAKAFWDDHFTSNDKDVKSVNDEALLTDIYDRDETDFIFDFEIDDEIKHILEKFEPDSWVELTDTEKESLIGELISALGYKLGLEELPSLKIFEDSKDKLGSFNISENLIEINKNIFDDPSEVIDTTAHEVRHAYQHQRAQKDETYVDKLYKLNFENYITPQLLPDGKYMFFTDYQDQYVEAEARAFANLFKQKEVS